VLTKETAYDANAQRPPLVAAGIGGRPAH
jgi:hypothetical protein